MNLKIIAYAHHRNGIGGAPFAVTLFEDAGPEGSRKVAILFDVVPLSGRIALRVQEQK